MRPEDRDAMWREFGCLCVLALGLLSTYCMISLIWWAVQLALGALLPQ